MSALSDNFVYNEAMTIERHFAELGFNQKEQKVYLALAEMGKGAATLISRRSGIPRATVYSMLESLAARGLIAKEKSRSGMMYAINDTSAFLRMVENEKEVLKKRETIARELVDLVSPYLRRSNYSVPKLQFFEGKQNIEGMFYHYLPEWRKSYQKSGDSTLWGYQDHEVVEQYRSWHNHLWETSKPHERIRLFTNGSNVEKELEHKIPGREVRALPEGVEFLSSIWLYGDFIIMAMTRQKPHYAFQIRDSVFASNLRAIFQLLWKARF